MLTSTLLSDEVMASMTSVRRVRLSLADWPRPRRARLCEKNRYRPPVVRSCVQVRRSSLARSPTRRCCPSRPAWLAAELARTRFGAAFAIQSRRPMQVPRLAPIVQNLRETPSSRASGNTASPALSRLIAASLKAVGKVLHVILSVIGHPLDNLSQKLPCLTYGVQSSTVTVIRSGAPRPMKMGTTRSRCGGLPVDLCA